MNNQELKTKYDEMHSQGQSAWFSDGHQEREYILMMGEPWKGLQVIEIGCGEGDLGEMIEERSVEEYIGVDYSNIALENARKKHGEDINYSNTDYHNIDTCFDRIVMQGVLEHLDDPFTELKWMMDNLLTEKGDVITSSPCFLNPRGIVWMTLNILGAVMSKTDLHYLDPWQFQKFANVNGYAIKIKYCDPLWGNGEEMIADFKQRLPLALKDGNIPYDQTKLDNFVEWLSQASKWMIHQLGANAVYRISK